MSNSHRTTTRRQFNRGVLAAAVSSLAAPAILRGQNLNSKLNIAIIGSGGRAGDDAKALASENLVAFCDVDGRLLSAAEKTEFAKMTVLDRWGDPKELMGPALLLASDAGAYITGETLVVDGGFISK